MPTDPAAARTAWKSILSSNLPRVRRHGRGGATGNLQDWLSPHEDTELGANGTDLLAGQVSGSRWEK